MSIRARLTLLYAVAFLLAGALLIALMYLNLYQFMGRRPGANAQGLARQYLAARHVTIPHEVISALASQAEQIRRETLRTMLFRSLMALGLLGVVAGGFGWLVAGRALRPLQQITLTARRVADRSLHERIALSGPADEIRDLADTFDAMLERLDRAFDGQRRFVANASHELRTPLTINRTLIEVALSDPEVPESTRRLGETLLEVNQRHERLIDGLLVLAGSEQQLTEYSPVDLGELAGQLTAHGGGDGVEIRCEPETASVLGDSVLLERLVQNLLDNAVRYNVPGGWVRVATRTEAAKAVVVVENIGPAVPESEVEGLFEPFRRLESAQRLASAARNVGLGLSIVRSVAHAHGGEVRAVARPEGGLTVTVTLPRSAQ
ncbi:sensor histidine kinase [Nocardia sp. NPDC059240]|uniref:sensor histidine kinase n=1 Tax=Nocardia sp. NPDC059240 TaxID=3346786 RepID=UPI0036A55F84